MGSLLLQFSAPADAQSISTDQEGTRQRQHSFNNRQIVFPHLWPLRSRLFANGFSKWIGIMCPRHSYFPQVGFPSVSKEVSCIPLTFLILACPKPLGKGGKNPESVLMNNYKVFQTLPSASTSVPLSFIVQRMKWQVMEKIGSRLYLLRHWREYRESTWFCLVLFCNSALNQLEEEC